MTSENYQMGYSEEWLKDLEKRSADNDAGHIARHVRPDSKILDVGCGPGSITMGIAELATSGSVIGVDSSDEQFDRAREQAKTRGLTNITFQSGDAYNLPFEDNTFDIVYENMLVVHLAEPDRAIAEFKRVLKPGGIIGLRDLYISGRSVYASTPCPVEDGSRRANRALLEVNLQHGADWDAGIKHRGRLKSAGFLNVESGTSNTVFASDEAWEQARSMTGIANLLVGMIRESTKLGIFTADEAEQVIEWTMGIADDPAAVSVNPMFHATGRKPG